MLKIEGYGLLVLVVDVQRFNNAVHVFRVPCDVIVGSFNRPARRKMSLLN
jgi:hypothetical protein